MAFALIGIVAMSLWVVKLGVGIGHALEHEALLQRENSTLAIEDSALSSGERIEALAGARGMVLAPPGALHFDPLRGALDARLAVAALATPAHARVSPTGSGASTAAETSPSSAAGAEASASTTAAGEAASSGVAGAPASASETAAAPTSEAAAAPAGSSTGAEAGAAPASVAAPATSQTASAPAATGGSAEASSAPAPAGAGGGTQAAPGG